MLTPATADKIAAARAQVASSQAAAEANLADLKVGATEGDLAVAAAQVQRAEAARALATVTLDETEQRASFGGTVATLGAKPGEYVTVGTPVLDLADFSAWQITTTDLTEQDIVHIHEGDHSTVVLDAIPDVELAGVGSPIQALGENKQGAIVYTVTITLDQQDSRLRWNMTASVRFAE